MLLISWSLWLYLLALTVRWLDSDLLLAIQLKLWFSDPFSDDFLQNFPHCKSQSRRNAKLIFSISPTSLGVRSRGASTDHSITASFMQTNLSSPFTSIIQERDSCSILWIGDCWLHKCRVICFHQNSKLTHRTLAGQLLLQSQLILTLCPSYPEVSSPDHWSHLCRVYPLSTDQECGVWSQLIKLLMGKVCNYWTGRGGSILTDDGGDDVKQLLLTPACI